MSDVWSAVSTEGHLHSAEVRVRGTLMTQSGRALCRVVHDRLVEGAGALTIDLVDVTTVDVVGLAALLQSVRFAATHDVRPAVLPSGAVQRALVDAKLAEEVPLLSAVAAGAGTVDAGAAQDRVDGPMEFVASTPHLGLRPPTPNELGFFEQWARDPLLDQMVGSELLFSCRHLGPYHREFVDLVSKSPTSLTLVVHPLEPPAPPVGFVRLYNINLVEGFAFLETAMASRQALRRGWGVEASRLLLAYAMDALELRRIEAKVYSYNVLSINSLKRNGFREEGVLRQARTYDGQRWNILVFSILRDEILEQRKQHPFPYRGFWHERE